jgi:hypothetical protein
MFWLLECKATAPAKRVVNRPEVKHLLLNIPMEVHMRLSRGLCEEEHNGRALLEPAPEIPSGRAVISSHT